MNKVIYNTVFFNLFTVFHTGNLYTGWGISLLPPFVNRKA